nr:hypothetical protein [Clostridia bacterium]
MKRIVFSNITKFIAVVLFVVRIVMGALVVTDGIITSSHEDEVIYNFESDFSQSHHISHLLNAPENALFNAYYNAFYDDDNFGHPVDLSDKLSENKAEIAENLREQFDDFYASDKIDWFVRWNDTVITNCDAKSAEELLQSRFHSYVKRDGSGNIERTSSHTAYNSYLIEDLERFDKTSTIVIGCRVKQDVADKYEAIW